MSIKKMRIRLYKSFHFCYNRRMKNSPEALKRRNEKRKYWRETIDKSTIPPFIIRICNNCGEEKEHLFNSSFTSKGLPEYKTRCQDCLNLTYKDYKKRNRQQITEKSRDKKNLVKLRAIEYLGGSCIVCGYNKSARALTFHHRNRDEKEYTISQIKDWSWNKIQNELDKCDLVCFNCHMEIEEEFDNNKNNVQT